MARSRGDDRNAGRFGEPPPPVGNVRRRGLVTRVQEIDPAADRRVVHRQDLVARQREDRLHAVQAKRLDEKIGARHALPDASAPATAHS